MFRTLCLVALLAVSCSAKQGHTLFAKGADLVRADIHQVARAIKGDDSIPTSTKRVQLGNLKEMNEDVKRWATMSGAEKRELEEDVRERLTELKGAIGMKMSTPSTKLTDSRKNRQFEEAESKVVADISKVRAALASADLDATARREAENNLSHIQADTNKLAHASGQHKEHLKQAIQFRTTALKEQLGVGAKESSPVSSKPLPVAHKAPKAPSHNALSSQEKLVERDISAVKQQLASLNPETRHLAEEDLSQIKKDMKQMTSADRPRRESLKKAVDLRLKALKQMLEEDDNDVEENDVDDVEENDADDVEDNVDVEDGEDSDDSPASFVPSKFHNKNANRKNTNRKDAANFDAFQYGLTEDNNEVEGFGESDSEE